MPLHEERRSGHGSSAMPSGREVESNERGDTRQAELLAEAGFPSSERLSETSKTPVAMEHAKSLGWVDGDQTWKILRWNPTQQHLEVEPVPTTDLVTQIVPVRKAITEETLLRPKSIRRRPQNASSFRWPSRFAQKERRSGVPTRRGLDNRHGARWAAGSGETVHSSTTCSGTTPECGS